MTERAELAAALHQKKNSMNWTINQGIEFIQKGDIMTRHGEEFEITGEELLATALCHELDHLDGILFKQKVSRMLTPEECEEMFS